MNTSTWWNDAQKGEAGQPAAGLCTEQIIYGRWEVTQPCHWLFSQCSPNTRPYNIPLCPSFCRSKHSTSSLDGGARGQFHDPVTSCQGLSPQYSWRPHSPSSPNGATAGNRTSVIETAESHFIECAIHKILQDLKLHIFNIREHWMYRNERDHVMWHLEFSR
jgi:hypothetical protein